MDRLEPGLEAYPYNMEMTVDSNTTNSAVLGDTSPVQVCHVCLATDTRLHALRDYQLDGMYEQLTGLTTAELLIQLCPLCTRRLTNHARFRECARASRLLLTNVVSQQNELSSQSKKLAELNLARLPPFTIHHKQQYDLDIVHKDKQPPLLGEIKVKIEKLQVENNDGHKPLRSRKPRIKKEKEPYVFGDDPEIDAILMDRDDVPPKDDGGKTIDNKKFLDENSDTWSSAIDSDDSCYQLAKELKTNVSFNIKKELPIKNKKRSRKVPVEAKIKRHKEVPNSDLESDDTLHTEIQFKTEITDNKESLDETNDASFSAIDNTTASSSKKQQIEKKIQKTLRVKTTQNAPKEKAKQAKKVPMEEDIDKTLFTITKLTHKDQMDMIEKRKESTNFTNALHKCTLCYKGFRDKEAYERHSFKHSDQLGEIECDLCKFRFKKRFKLVDHLKTCHLELYKCNSCSFTTHSKTTAFTHQRWHNGKRYQCTQCPESFEKQTSYLSHVRIVHPSDVSCQLCGYSFLNEKGLFQHLNLTHHVDKQELITEGPRCEECDKIFATEEALSTHRKIQHVKSRRKRNAPNVKKIQKEPIEERKVLNSDGTWSLSCIECGKMFQIRRSYLVHMRLAHKQGIKQCHICGKIFPAPSHLRYHMEIHDESVTYPCPECGKRFKTNLSLYQHRRKHSMRERPGCPLCPMTFSSTSNRDRHFKYTHKTVKDVQCEYCPKKFKSPADLYNHRRFVHLKNPLPKRVRNRNKKSEA